MTPGHPGEATVGWEGEVTPGDPGEATVVREGGLDPERTGSQNGAERLGNWSHRIADPKFSGGLAAEVLPRGGAEPSTGTTVGTLDGTPEGMGGPPDRLGPPGVEARPEPKEPRELPAAGSDGTQGLGKRRTA